MRITSIIATACLLLLGCASTPYQKQQQHTAILRNNQNVDQQDKVRIVESEGATGGLSTSAGDRVALEVLMKQNVSLSAENRALRAENRSVREAEAAVAFLAASQACTEWFTKYYTTAAEMEADDDWERRLLEGKWKFVQAKRADGFTQRDMKATFISGCAVFSIDEEEVARCKMTLAELPGESIPSSDIFTACLMNSIDQAKKDACLSCFWAIIDAVYGTGD